MCGRSRVTGASIQYAHGMCAGSSSQASSSTTSSGNNTTSSTETEPTVDTATTNQQEAVTETFTPCENCIPGRATPIVVRSKEQQHLKVKRARWGLIPSYTPKTSKLDFFRMNNARIERLNKVHARLIKRQKKCVVVVDGFYEWKITQSATKGSFKQPYYLHMKGGTPLLLAGFYDVWYDEEDTPMMTYTIVTMPVSESLKWLHTRMPAVLPTREHAMRWLQNDDWTQASRLLAPDNESLAWYPVTPRINKSTYQESDCAVPIKLEKLKTLTSFFKSPSKTAKSNSMTAVTGGKRERTDDEGDQKTREKNAKEEKTKDTGSPVSAPKSPVAKKLKPVKKKTPQQQMMANFFTKK